MHPSTAATILARQAILDICTDGGPVVIDVESKLGTTLTRAQADAIMAALEVLHVEIEPHLTPDREIREARQVLTDQARDGHGTDAEDIE